MSLGAVAFRPTRRAGIVFALLHTLLLLSACGNTPEKIRMSAKAVPNLERVERAALRGEEVSTEEANEALDKDYFAVLSDCSQALSRFESEGKRRSTLAQALAFSGLLAGAVAVPALTAAGPVGNASWISGLGGLAGATNTAQHWIQQSGLSYIESLRTREQIRSDFKVAIEEFLSSNDPQRRRASLLRAKAACVLYAVSIPNVQLIQADGTFGNGGSEPDEPEQPPKPTEQPAQPPEETAPKEPPTDPQPPATEDDKPAEAAKPAGG